MLLIIDLSVEKYYNDRSMEIKRFDIIQGLSRHNRGNRCAYSQIER